MLDCLPTHHNSFKLTSNVMNTTECVCPLKVGLDVRNYQLIDSFWFPHKQYQLPRVTVQQSGNECKMTKGIESS